jgi:hypothetical protein
MAKVQKYALGKGEKVTFVTLLTQLQNNRTGAEEIEAKSFQYFSLCKS